MKGSLVQIEQRLDQIPKEVYKREQENQDFRKFAKKDKVNQVLDNFQQQIKLYESRINAVEAQRAKQVDLLPPKRSDQVGAEPRGRKRQLPNTDVETNDFEV